MKLTKIQVQNFRSILTTQSIKLNESFTVILGPNNEGKSNLLRAIVLAMECLRGFRGSYRIRRPRDAGTLRLPRDVYDWENDFPRNLQNKLPDGQTTLTLDFELTSSEQNSFRDQCGSVINGALPTEIQIGAKGATFRVKKPGRGAKTYEQNSTKIAQFISMNFGFEYIPAIRPGQLSLQVIGNLLEREMYILSEDEEYKQALQTIDALEQPIYERLESSVQEHLKKLLPSVKQVSITTAQDTTYRGRFRPPQLVIDDGTATPLDAKGDGIKSLAAISLMRASRTGGKAGSLVVAIEEPESHLHPGAVRQLATVLQEMSGEHQVIITTHSPLLVARSSIQANIIVSKSKATPADSIKAIRDSLGVQVEDNLTAAEYVILVEGKTDIESLTTIFNTRSPDFKALFASGKIVFDDMGGAGNIRYKLSHLSQSVTTQILITDDDVAGRNADKAAGLAGLEEAHRFTWKRPSEFFRATELEDLINTDIYWDTIQTDFGVYLNRAEFDVSKDKWAERMKVAYEAGGKRWSSSIENNMKGSISKLVSTTSSHAVATTHTQLVDNILSAIVKVVCPR